MIRAARRDYLDRPPGPDFARIERDIDAFLAEQAAGARELPVDEAARGDPRPDPVRNRRMT